MPDYVLNRNYTHRSLLGHSVEFKKGEPVFVPPILEKEVVAIGAQRVDGENPAVVDEAPVTPPELTDDQRQDELYAAFDLLVERNETTDFTAQGIPTVKAVEKIVGFNVEKKEVAESYAAYRIAKQEV